MNGTTTPNGVDHGPNGSQALGRSPVNDIDLASWLLAKEIGIDPQDLPAAAERVCHKLSRRLSRWVSPAGSQAILGRALHLGRVEFPFLEGVRAGRPPEACFLGLDERAHDIEASTVGHGLLLVLRIQLGLLVGFIGEDLTVRLLSEARLDLPSVGSIRTMMRTETTQTRTG